MALSKRARKNGRPAKAHKKPVRRKAAALRARAEHKLSNGTGRVSQGMARSLNYATLPMTTVLATAETMVRCSRPFAELPLRAARARTPSEMWSVHQRFVQDVMSEGLLATKRFWTLRT
jgi:hypothetical protein